MFNNSSKLLFFTFTMVSSLMAVSATSWLGAWMGLEINLLSFIPLMSDSNNLMSSESSLKYFLTQALASSVLLFSVILFMLESNLIFKSFLDYPSSMILFSLLIKSGAAPFHFWFPLVMEGLSWTNALILMTWQKLAPLTLISYTNENNIIGICVIASVVVGSLSGLNQTSLRKLLAYSSINHLGWMLIAMTSSEILWLNYYSFYVFLSFIVVILFNFMGVGSLNQLFSMPFHSLAIKFMLFLGILSLGGLPPFVGFFPSWMVIEQLILNSQFVMVFILVLCSLVTLFFYLRLGYSAFVIGHSESNWNLKISFGTNMFKLILVFSFFSLIGLLMVSLFFWLS
uniref:NADH-ubiquinone oxidoreductase chain 2 n=1 Tax=Limnia unguicornis TaxID=1226590 RepID=A0A7D6WEU2_9MUSC|nr:NADH dehydrogenase subunit 2 [Limnia unguicornis]